MPKLTNVSKKAKEAPAETRKCDICPTVFTPVVYWQKHCSKSCKLAAWAIRRSKKANAPK